MSVVEKVQEMSVSRNVSITQEDSTALALMVLNSETTHNAKVD